MKRSSALKFFKYAVERQMIHLERAAGYPRPWTTDPVLGHYRFCNVFREDDKTTKWFRENVRERLRAKPEVLLATVLFRMLNRIETGEAVFSQLGLGGETAFGEYVRTGDIRVVKRAIVNYVGKRGPYVTGAYIITGYAGMPKLDGVLKVVDNFKKTSWWMMEGQRLIQFRGDVTLEKVWHWLSQFPHLGVFHSYEIVTDLRHTALLDSAPDIMTWANPGPGARRGLNRLHGRDLKSKVASREQLIDEMRELLELSNDRDLWPGVSLVGHKKVLCGPQWFWDRVRDDGDRGLVGLNKWPAWEMRDVEHTLCEYDKMERARLGQGRPRGVFR